MKKSRSSILTKLVLLAVVIYAVASLLSLNGQIKDAETQRETLAAQVAAAELQNEKLQQQLDQYSEESTEQIARNRLGLVSKDELVFYDIGN